MEGEGGAEEREADLLTLITILHARTHTQSVRE